MNRLVLCLHINALYLRIFLHNLMAPGIRGSMRIFIIMFFCSVIRRRFPVRTFHGTFSGKMLFLNVFRGMDGKEAETFFSAVDYSGDG